MVVSRRLSFFFLLSAILLHGCGDMLDEKARNSLLSATDKPRLDYCLQTGGLITYRGLSESTDSKIKRSLNPRKVYKCYRKAAPDAVEAHSISRQESINSFRKTFQKSANAIERMKMLKMEMKPSPYETAEERDARKLVSNKIDYCNTPKKYRHLGYWKTKSERLSISDVSQGDVYFFNCYDRTTEEEVKSFMQK